MTIEGEGICNTTLNVEYVGNYCAHTRVVPLIWGNSRVLESPDHSHGDRFQDLSCASRWGLNIAGTSWPRTPTKALFTIHDFQMPLAVHTMRLSRCGYLDWFAFQDTSATGVFTPRDSLCLEALPTRLPVSTEIQKDGFTARNICALALYLVSSQSIEQLQVFANSFLFLPGYIH